MGENQVKIISYESMKVMTSEEKISQIFNYVKNGEIIVLEGRLSAEESLKLTNKALRNISAKFTGIEIAHLQKEIKLEENLFEFVKEKIIYFLAKNRLGITVIGPSKKIKEIKMDPSKLDVLFK